MKNGTLNPLMNSLTEAVTTAFNNHKSELERVLDSMKQDMTECLEEAVVATEEVGETMENRDGSEQEHLTNSRPLIVGARLLQSRLCDEVNSHIAIHSMYFDV